MSKLEGPNVRVAASLIPVVLLIVGINLGCTNMANPESTENLGASGTSTGASLEAARSAGDPVRWKTQVCLDPEADGMEAFRIVMPSDWQFEGGIRWMPERTMAPAEGHFRVRSPGGAEEVELVPAQVFFWADDPLWRFNFPPGSRYFGTEVHAPVDALVALREIVLPRFRRGAANLRVVKEERLEDPLKPAGSVRPQPGSPPPVDSAKIRIEYERDGIPIEEEIYAAVTRQAIPFGFSGATLWSVDYIFSFKARKGALEENQKLFQTVANSLRTNPDWFNRYSQVIEVLAQIQIQNIRAVGRVSEIISRTSDEISEMSMQAYNNRQAVQDRVADNFSRYIRGVDAYYDPIEERSVELPSGHQDAWSNPLGEFILSDNPNFDPNVGSNLHWQRMRRRGP